MYEHLASASSLRAGALFVLYARCQGGAIANDRYIILLLVIRRRKASFLFVISCIDLDTVVFRVSVALS